MQRKVEKLNFSQNLHSFIYVFKFSFNLNDVVRQAEFWALGFTYNSCGCFQEKNKCKINQRKLYQPLNLLLVEIGVSHKNFYGEISE